ncbi:MAG: hypothetical protein AAGA03_13775 [Planctomycetota bacterium]
MITIQTSFVTALVIAIGMPIAIGQELPGTNTLFPSDSESVEVVEEGAVAEGEESGSAFDDSETNRPTQLPRDPSARPESELAEIFDNTLSDEERAAFTGLPSPFMVMMPSDSMVYANTKSKNGARRFVRRSVTTYQPRSLDPLADNLTIEERCATNVAMIQRELNESLRKVADTSGMVDELALAEVREWYDRLYQMETDFQDLKVLEIEKRTSTLRNQVEQRRNAKSQWVDAMVTLAKMKAMGIEPARVESTRAVSTVVTPPPLSSGYRAATPVPALPSTINRPTSGGFSFPNPTPQTDPQSFDQ